MGNRGARPEEDEHGDEAREQAAPANGRQPSPAGLQLREKRACPWCEQRREVLVERECRAQISRRARRLSHRCLHDRTVIVECGVRCAEAGRPSAVGQGLPVSAHRVQRPAHGVVDEDGIAPGKLGRGRSEGGLRVTVVGLEEGHLKIDVNSGRGEELFLGADQVVLLTGLLPAAAGTPAVRRIRSGRRAVAAGRRDSRSRQAPR